MKHIILLVLAVLLIMPTAAQDTVLSDIDYLLQQALAALQNNDLQTAQTLILGAASLITPQEQAACPSLSSVEVLLTQAGSAASAAEAVPLVTSASVLLSVCLGDTVLVPQATRAAAPAILQPPTATEEARGAAVPSSNVVSGTILAPDGTFLIDLPQGDWQVFDANDGSAFFVKQNVSPQDMILMRVMGPAFAAPAGQFSLRTLSGDFTFTTTVGSVGEMLGRPSPAFNTLFGAPSDVQVIIRETSLRQYEPRYGNLNDGRRWATIRFEFDAEPQDESHQSLRLEGVVMVLALDGGGHGAVRIYTQADQFDRLGDPLLDGLANSFSTRGLTARNTQPAATPAQPRLAATPAASGASVPTFSRIDVATVATTLLTDYLRGYYMRPAAETWHVNNSGVTPGFAAALSQFWRTHSDGFDLDPVICAGADVSSAAAVGGAVAGGDAQFDLELGVSFGAGSSQSQIVGTVTLQYDATAGWQIADVACTNQTSSTTAPSALTAVEVVDNFYGWYIQQMEDFIVLPSDWYHEGPFTSGMIASLDAQFRSGNALSGADPFLLAQNLPNDYRATHAGNLSTTRQIVRVRLNFGMATPYLLAVEVERVNGTWLIDRIRAE